MSLLVVLFCHVSCVLSTCTLISQGDVAFGFVCIKFRVFLTFATSCLCSGMRMRFTLQNGVRR